MQAVETNNAPPPVGAYSQGVIDSGRVYVSGQVGHDPATGEVVSEDITEQTERAIKNVEAVLDTAGTSLDNAVKTNVYLTDIDKFEEFNEMYDNYLSKPYPARAVVEVGNLISPYGVEIEMIASLP